jgi:hypothetical protein
MASLYEEYQCFLIGLEELEAQVANAESIGKKRTKVKEN